MLIPEILKPQIHIFTGVWGGGWWPTSDAESKNVKIPNSHFHRCGKGRVGSQLLMLSPEMLNSKIHIFAGGEGWRPTFDAESRNAKIPNSHFHRWERGIESPLLMLRP